MRKLFKQKKQKQIFFILSLFFLIYSFSIGIRNYFRYNDLSNRIVNKEKQLTFLINKKRELQIELSRLDKRYYLEYKAKEMFGYKKKGEKVYVFY